jgi:hypothetical protein
LGKDQEHKNKKESIYEDVEEKMRERENKSLKGRGQVEVERNYED